MTSEVPTADATSGEASHVASDEPIGSMGLKLTRADRYFLIIGVIALVGGGLLLLIGYPEILVGTLFGVFASVTPVVIYTAYERAGQVKQHEETRSRITETSISASAALSRDQCVAFLFGSGLAGNPIDPSVSEDLRRSMLRQQRAHFMALNLNDPELMELIESKPSAIDQGWFQTRERAYELAATDMVSARPDVVSFFRSGFNLPQASVLENTQQFVSLIADLAVMKKAQNPVITPGLVDQFAKLAVEALKGGDASKTLISRVYEVQELVRRHYETP